MAKDLIEDLAKGVGEAIDKSLEPLDALDEQIEAALADVRKSERELLAQKERLERMKDAARLRKRPGRMPGSKRKQAEPLPA